ncbi:MAG: 1,4-dihydroxy-2-naphthoate polyprenyltransferase [Acidobacteria bacterium]|nr:MAG: 1,4-dihydroxy-2-naphthoate polyprenyltransferase [Acidobacteriota bacterium]
MTARGAGGIGPLLRAYALAARPKTLPAAVAPVLVGAAAARAAGTWRTGPALAAAAGALLIQIGTNFANDVYDYEKGADTAERRGPLRVTQAGLLSPRQVRAGMVAAFGAAVAVGIYLAAVAGWPVVAIGVASIAAGIAYTAGPMPLAYVGLGEPFVFLFFGLVAVCGTSFVVAGRVPGLAWGAAVPVGALATAILVVNNVRDHDTDRKAGKRTFAARFGRRAGLAELAGLLVLAYLASPALAAAARSPALVLPALTLPSAVRLYRTVARHEDGPTLNRALAGSARLLLLYAILLAAGLLAAGSG